LGHSIQYSYLLRKNQKKKNREGYQASFNIEKIKLHLTTGTTVEIESGNNSFYPKVYVIWYRKLVMCNLKWT